jgi:hypothetical protein
MLRSEHGKAERRSQRVELLSPCLRASAVGRERIGSDAELVGNKAERRSRNGLIRPQRPTGITESAELQREAELVRVAAAAFHGGQVGGAQRPVLDQHGLGGRQGEQLRELLVGEDAASRHGGLSQVE